METCRQAEGGRKTWRHAWVGNMETCRQAGGGRKTWRHAGKLGALRIYGTKKQN